ncbi:hypothetical protein QOT17_018786 [Balamuthia mandrillaris]
MQVREKINSFYKVRDVGGMKLEAIEPFGDHFKSTITYTITCVDQWFNTLICLVNNIADHFECIETTSNMTVTWNPFFSNRKTTFRLSTFAPACRTWPSQNTHKGLRPLPTGYKSPSSTSCPLCPTSGYSVAECKQVKQMKDGTQTPSKANTSQHHNGNNYRSSSSSSSSSGHPPSSNKHTCHKCSAPWHPSHQCKPCQPTVLNSSQAHTSLSQQPALAPLLPTIHEPTELQKTTSSSLNLCS